MRKADFFFSLFLHCILKPCCPFWNIVSGNCCTSAVQCNWILNKKFMQAYPKLWGKIKHSPRERESSPKILSKFQELSLSDRRAWALVLNANSVPKVGLVRRITMTNNVKNESTFENLQLQFANGLSMGGIKWQILWIWHLYKHGRIPVKLCSRHINADNCWYSHIRKSENPDNLQLYSSTRV